jgi:hypothetical protein
MKLIWMERIQTAQKKEKESMLLVLVLLNNQRKHLTRLNSSIMIPKGFLPMLVSNSKDHFSTRMKFIMGSIKII